VLGQLELLEEAGHQLVNRWLIVVYDDIPRHTISKNDCSDKINYVLLFCFEALQPETKERASVQHLFVIKKTSSSQLDFCFMP